MEKKIQEILDLFTESKLQKQSQKFLEKFWLSDEDIAKYWEIKKNTIFSMSFRHLPDILFRDGFKITAQRGGVLFTQDEYQLLQECMKMAGDTFFVIIENRFIRKETDSNIPYLQFKFPVCTAWAELNNGNENYPDISHELLWMMDKEYFVFGDSGQWGKYVASDYYDTPLDIIGFKPELTSTFQEHFKLTQEEQKEVWQWLPQEYKQLIK